MDPITFADIKGAVARGWCTERNEKKEMDVYLAMAISEEIGKLFCIKPTCPYNGEDMIGMSEADMQAQDAILKEAGNE